MPVLQTDIQKEEYTRYAEHCLKMAKVATDRRSRIIQRQMAAEWLRLAGAVSSNGRSSSMHTEPSASVAR
jgi:hypothetical protein